MNPLDWISSVGAWLVRTITDVANAITRFTTWIVGWVTNIVGWIGSLYNTLVNVINAAVGSIWGTIRSMWDWVNQIANAVIPSIIRWASDGINAVTRWAQSAYSSVVRWATDSINRIWGWANQLVDWINHSVVGPIWQRITGLADWINHQVLDWVRSLYNEATDLIHSVIKWAADQIGGLADWVRNLIAPLVDIIDKVKGWLEFFAQHPFSWFTDLLHHLADRAAGEILAAMMNAVAKEGDGVETWIARWIAGTMAMVAPVAMAPLAAWRRVNRWKGGR